MKITLDSLITDGLQTRAAINSETVAEYAEAMQGGANFPPIVVYGNFLADGFHRVAAAREIGLTELDADCREGTREDALRYALAANAAHGLRRTNADKRRALELAWLNRQTLFGHDPSSRELSALTAVSHNLANTFIKECGVSFYDTHSTPNSQPSTSASASASTSTSTSPTDRFGEIIPEKLLPSFHCAALRKLTRTLTEVRKTIEAHVADNDQAFVAVPQQALINLDNVIRELRFAEPYCVCRFCAGEGCYRCNQLGFMSAVQYRQLPQEYRASAHPRTRV